MSAVSIQRQAGSKEAALPEPNTANVSGTAGKHRNTSRFSTTSTRLTFHVSRAIAGAGTKSRPPASRPEYVDRDQESEIEFVVDPPVGGTARKR